MRVVKTVEGRLDASSKRIGVVSARWNELVVKELVEGALDSLRACGDPEVILVKTPGTWEIPLAAKLLIDVQGCDAVIALGCIMQGATSHAQLLASDVASALMSLQRETGVPIAWGILTPENQDQALDRAGLKMGNKGREAALAAVEMIGIVGWLSEPM